LGQRIVHDIRAEGVGVHANVDPTVPTGLMIKERRTADAQRITYYRAGSAASRLSESDVPEAAIASAEILHLTGITSAISPSGKRAVLHAIEVAHQARTTVSFDLNYRSALWGRAEAGRAYREILTRVDVVFAGADEALIATQGSAARDDPMDIAKELLSLGPTTAVIKLGPDGATAITKTESVRVPAVKIQAVDTVGAGDAFVAGYLSAQLDGEPLAACVERGVTVGAFVCTTPGDWEGLPWRSDLTFLASDSVHR
jgi:2-dehydro-3-deoxygluconokinase